MAQPKSAKNTGKTPLLSALQVSKSFGDFVANQAINFTIYPGELHALLGENGAGKSTFVKMVYGLLQPDSGHFEWQGEKIQLSNPQQARATGIGMVFQHFSLFEALSVAENIRLALPAEYQSEDLAAEIASKSADYGIPLKADQIIADLSVGQRQRVEIMRCLLQNPALLIMDEPTSVLTPQETEQLFAVLRRLADQGCAVLFISHKLDEIKQLTSRATILRGGKKVAELNTRDKTTRQLAELMVGSQITDIKRRKPPAKQIPLFEVAGLNRPALSPFEVALKDIHLTASKGEILGIAGIAGNGQGELMEALTGEWCQPADHRIQLAGRELSAAGPLARRKAGVCFIPEERNGHAAVPSMNLAENALLTSYEDAKTVSGGVISQQETLLAAEKIARTFDVRRPSANPLASALSGGNLQKFVVGREIIKKPAVLIVSQPTWGVDVGAAQFIRKAMTELAEQGSAVIMISQDLEEIFAISHKIAVLNDGHLSAARPAGDMTAEEIGLLMGGAAETAQKARRAAR
ncbi:MAG: ABC transporter ATP-binding protein [Alphaproteobacteria bacterium]|jgi:ABC-type uncharacterized transport system ATPase subunit|nr:ABC transporter ATP-binding protein [Alphaproteobacteria bacterium]